MSATEELQEEVQQLKSKLQKTEADFEAYKVSAKELEDFLEEESSKKEEEIRTLKQDLIVKEKQSKLAKQELSMLQATNSDLLGQLQTNKKQIQSQQQGKEAQVGLLGQINDLKKGKTQLVQQLIAKDETISQQNVELKEKRHLEVTVRQLNNSFTYKNQRIATLQMENNHLRSQLKDAINDKKAQKIDVKSEEKKKDTDNVEVLRKQQQTKAQGRIKQLEEDLTKSDKQIKMMKNKLHSLSQQNQHLQSRALNMSINNTQSPSPILIKSIHDEQDFSIRPNFQCFLLTKPHYISPFLQIYHEKKIVKIYKSSRTGCFEKSMGSSRHKLERVAFDQESILEPIVSRIMDTQRQLPHTVIFYGVKKTTKKYLMSKLLVYLKDFLVEMMELGEEMQAVFMKRSQEEDKNFTLNTTTKEGVLEVIDKVISLGCKSAKPKEKSLGGSRKVMSKPKVRYFRITIDDFSLEVGTSSFTSYSFREKNSVVTMMNNILYSKLPNCLQSTTSQKYLILTLNPIVDLYEDCKNTLSATLCRTALEGRDDLAEQQNWTTSSPVREQLNDVAKKKIECFQRQNEQSSLRMRRLEQDVSYYRVRFDELQFRLKNLLNTHSAQNTYLKKSPVTLSYEKLLKFVHSVQQRNGIEVSLTHGQSMMLKSGLSPDKSSEWMEGM